jgi:hypothetical protein
LYTQDEKAIALMVMESGIWGFALSVTLLFGEDLTVDMDFLWGMMTETPRLPWRERGGRERRKRIT